jgi:formylglycine-generating enzyme required for sulfatase activity
LWLLRTDDDQGEPPAFYMSKSPITNEEYEAFDSGHARCESSAGDRDPVVNVSFREAVAYCEWYSRASRKSFRLPREVEWEFACRARGGARYFWGDDPSAGDPFVWDAKTSAGRVHEIETARANPAGLHDMLGNVWEWTVPDPDAANPDAKPAQESAAANRPIRGGSFRTPRAELGCGARALCDPDERRDDLSFRIVRFL